MTHRSKAALTDQLATLLMADKLFSPLVMTLIQYLIQAGESADSETFVRELAQRVSQHGEALITEGDRP